MVPRSRDAKKQFKRGQSGGYLCEIPGCPKSGMPLTQDVAKNHRKSFKKYGYCLKQQFTKKGGPPYTLIDKSKNGESIYPRRCLNQDCPMGDQLLKKSVYNYHKRNFNEHGVCTRDQLERNQSLYPRLCENPDCPNKKPLKKDQFLRHLQNFQSTGSCYLVARTKKRKREFPKKCKNPLCPTQTLLQRDQWDRHYENYMATGHCHKKREVFKAIQKKS